MIIITRPIYVFVCRKRLCVCVSSSWVHTTTASVENWHGHNNFSIQWRNNERDSVSNHQPYDCLLNRLFRHRSKKTSKLRVIGLCAGNSPGTGEFPAQMASNAENVSIWWRHHVLTSSHRMWIKSLSGNTRTTCKRWATNLLHSGWLDDVIKWKHFRVTGLFCGEFTGHR